MPVILLTYETSPISQQTNRRSFRVDNCRSRPAEHRSRQRKARKHTKVRISHPSAETALSNKGRHNRDGRRARGGPGRGWALPTT